MCKSNANKQKSQTLTIKGKGNFGKRLHTIRIRLKKFYIQ